jgi:hypothetical protein
MGGGSGGSYSTSSSTLINNHQELAKEFPLDHQGKFGTYSNPTVQQVFSDNPEKTARYFFEKLGKGGNHRPLENGKGEQSTFGGPRESSVVFRPTSSSDGSPTVSIVIKGPDGISYKIHFVSPKQEK